jgi:hypothetical protein
MIKKVFKCSFLLFSFCAVTAYAQDEYPKPGQMKPDMTEFWLPQPQVITPGDIKTNSAPSDALVLFDGKDLKAWENAKTKGDAGWIVNTDGTFTVKKSEGDIQTKESFDNFQLHIEWCVPEKISGEGQARGNSGIFLQGKYELQVLDNYINKTYSNGQAGSIYKQSRPLVNAMRKPGEWNVYDIIYKAPVFNEDGTYLYPPLVTVLHNGVVVQNNTAISGTTEYIGIPRIEKHGKGPVVLQSHGDPSEPISFRNIWIRKL